MGLISFGFVTLALFVAVFKIQESYQYYWVTRGYLVYALWEFGLRLSHAIGLFESAIGAIHALMQTM